MRTILGIQQTLTGMLIGNFKLVGKMANNTAVDTADQIIQFLQEEDNLCVPPNDDLATVTAQRDKLLEALNRIASYGKASFKGDYTAAQIAREAIKEVEAEL